MSGETRASTVPSERGGFTALADFIAREEDAIVAGWMTFVADKVASRSLDADELENEIRRFLADVRTGLTEGEQRGATAASEHGRQRHRVGFHLASMVAEYGLLLQAVEKIAIARGVELDMAEFAALARHVVAGVADATSSFVETQRAERDADARRHFGFIAHELRSPIQTMGLALDLLREEGTTSPAFGALERSLATVRELIDHSLVDVQQRSLGAGPSAEPTRFDLVELVREIATDSEAHGQARGVTIAVEAPNALEVTLDRGLMRSVLTNLVRNAIKFSCSPATVTVRAKEASGRLHLEVEDECGGLPEGAASRMFEPFSQLGADRSGFGLGLAITHQAVVAQSGRVQVHDLENGCVFIVDLPMHFDPDATNA